MATTTMYEDYIRNPHQYLKNPLEGFSLLNYGTVSEDGKFVPSVPIPFVYETEDCFNKVTIGEVIDGTPYVVSRFEDVWRVGGVGKVRVIECVA